MGKQYNYMDGYLSQDLPCYMPDQIWGKKFDLFKALPSENIKA